MSKLAAVLAALAMLALPTAASAWPTWGNLETNDCAFAAAANWELLHGGTTATEAEVVAEYQALTGEEDEGIDGEELEAYWRLHGIAGKRASVHSVAPEHLVRTMRKHGPVIAQLGVTPGERWGPVTDEDGGVHFAVVRYLTRHGPVLLTWGELAPMTWAQWREDSLVLYVPTLLPS